MARARTLARIGVALACGLLLIGSLAGCGTKTVTRTVTVVGTVPNGGATSVSANVAAGAHDFTQFACAQCHGDLTKKESAFGESFYPAAPQIILHPLDDPEWHVFYAVKHGVARTGMPAWDKTTSDEDLWKVTAFLSRIEKLPPAVQQQLNKAVGTSP